MPNPGSPPIPDWIRAIKSQTRRHTWRYWWQRPWTVPRRNIKAVGFKRALRRHGRLSPNFRIVEFRSKRDPCGCPGRNPRGLKRLRAQKLAFKLERVRHRLGNEPIGVLSGYRSSCHNACVGGASRSQHKTGRAIDPLLRGNYSRRDFDQEMAREFDNGGIGRGSVTGYVQHVDTGKRRRWFYAGR